VVHTELDKPPDKEFRCRICGEPMVVTHHWIEVLDRWMHASVHVACQGIYDRQRAAETHKSQKSERAIPERFLTFDAHKANPEALAIAQSFMPDSKLKTLAIIGPSGRGKSRLMWATIGQFFDILEMELGAKRWVEYFLFSDLVSELDRTELNRLKIAKYAFLDDVGVVESYGKERASLQQVIRARIQKDQNWTFMTIDSLLFDNGLKDFMRGRAVTIYLDQ
jgi:DNA replication protein DnaC